MTKTLIVAGCALAGATALASAQMRITEYMYSGTNVGGVDGEFIEFTNVGGSPIDLTGWSFDDNTPGTPTSLSSAGIVAPGQSILLCQTTPAAFRTAWGLSASVVVIGGNANNLGRADEINLYDAGSTLIDRLTFDDQTFLGTIRTQNASGNTPYANLGTNNIAGWSLSTLGDVYGSYAATTGNLANPGTYTPTPGALALLALGGGIASRRRRA